MEKLIERSINYQIVDATDLSAELELEIICAQTLAVTNDNECQYANETLRRFVQFGKKVEEFRKSAVAPLNEEKMHIQDIFKPILEKVDNTTRSLKEKIGQFQLEQERKSKEAMIKAAEEAKKAKEAKIAEAMQHDDPAIQAAIIQEAEATSMAMIKPTTTTPKKGVRVTNKYKAEVYDVVAFVKYIAANPQFVNFLKIDSRALDKFVSSTEGKVEIPGVKVNVEQHYAVNSRSKKKIDADSGEVIQAA